MAWPLFIIIQQQYEYREKTEKGSDDKKYVLNEQFLRAPTYADDLEKPPVVDDYLYMYNGIYKTLEINNFKQKQETIFR